MSKRSIHDFFKPFAFPRDSGHPLPDESSETSRPSQRLRSNNTTEAAIRTTGELSLPSITPSDVHLISSQSSVLSSLSNMTPSTPEEHTRRAREDLSARLHEGTPNQLLGEEFTASQAPIASSSQRTVKNGEVIIRDSDDERSDSDISLEDLDDIIASRRPPPNSFPSSEDDPPSLPSLPTTRSKTPRQTGKDRSMMPTAGPIEPRPVVIPKFKPPLDKLIRQRQLDEDSRLSIKTAKSLLDNLEKEEPKASAIRSTNLDEDLLAAVVKNEDDAGDMERLKGAIERTEALDQPKAWRFFDEDGHGSHVEPPVCPAISDPYWKSVFEGSSPLFLGNSYA